MEKIPIVAQPTAIEGTIQCTEGKEVQPNQKRPMGNKMDSTQTKYRRPSAEDDNFPNRIAIFSCEMLMMVMRTTPTHMAKDTYALAVEITPLVTGPDAVLLTGEHSTCLLNIKAMVCAEYQRDGAELKVQSGPAE